MIVYYEFANGLKEKSRVVDFDAFLKDAEIQVIFLDLACTKAAANIERLLKRSNQRIGFADTLIAGTAIAHGLPLATLNRKHFERVADLQLV